MDTVDTKNCFEPEEGEKIIEIELERLRTFRNHPFKVRMDDEMMRLMESIEKYGIITPLVVRPIPEGAYEIIAGHRRKAAAEKLGYRKVPVIIRVMADDDAVIKMVDSNVQRAQITFSEKAFAYKMKYEATLSILSKELQPGRNERRNIKAIKLVETTESGRARRKRTCVE